MQLKKNINLGIINFLILFSLFICNSISYSDEIGADQWHYFFDPKNFKIRGVKVEHKGRISLIINELYETKTGLSLNKSRKSYFLNSVGKIEYLRAAYKYEILSFNYKK